MRNAGDLAVSTDLLPHFQTLAKMLAEKLDLPITLALFSIPAEGLERANFERFEQEVDVVEGVMVTEIVSMDQVQ